MAKNNKLFILAQLHNQGEWFIYYSVIDPSTGKMRRKKEYAGFTGKTEEERYSWAVKRINDLNKELMMGYNPFVKDEKNVYVPDVCLKAIIDETLKIRCRNLRKKSVQTYESKVRIFKKWLDENNYGMILARDFSHDHAVEFLRSRELNNTSINYYRDQLKSLFELMRREKKIRDNPFDGIPKLKENRQGKLPYREDQINELKTRITLQYPILWLHIEFIAYCGIRTNELRLLKIANIDFQSQQIFIPGDISKNGQTEYVDIPNQFYKKLLLLKMDKMRSENYVFSKRGLGVSNVPWSRDHFSKMHKEVLLQAGITDPHYSLYSWKSTGAIRAVRSGVGIKDLQKQWRHKHISTTDIYLQSIGAYPNEEIRTKIPEL